MKTALTVFLGLGALLTLGSGITALATERVPSWLAPRVVRPRMYGIGQVLYGAFTALLAASRISHYTYDVYMPMRLVTVGVLCAIGGTAASFFSQRPRRLPQLSDGQHNLSE